MRRMCYPENLSTVEPHDSTFIIDVEVRKQKPNDDRNPRKEIAREPAHASSGTGTS